MENGSFERALFNLLLVFVLLVMLPEMPHADVILIGNSISYSFNDMKASFVPEMEGSGFCGRLQVAEPSDACSPLRNKVVGGEGVDSPFALVQRGACSFDRKIGNAQDAGFKAAIVYNNIDKPELVPMGGNSTGVVIYAVFVSKATGELLLKYAGDPNMECWIVPSLKNAWSVMAISFAILVTMALVLATCIFLRKYWVQQGERGNPNIQQLNGMSYRLVKALPSLIFSSVTDDNCTSETCAICLENYTFGEKLRILPCFHKFHALCVDNWLMMWRTFCPVCKQDARSRIMQLPMTENTPLLYGNISMSSGGSAQSSLLGASSYMHIPSSSSLPHTESSKSHHFHNASSDMPQILGSYSGSSNFSRNPGDVGNASFLSVGIHSSMSSPQNLLCASPEITPSMDFQYGSFLIPSSYNSSPESDASGPSPSFTSFIPSCVGSVAVISPFHSTQSLPGYQECFV